MKSLKTGNYENLMTAPVLASRTPVFSPSIRQGKTNWSVANKYGSASVVGEITQIHRNILDSIFGFAIAVKTMHTGAIEILVDPYEIATKTGSSRDYKWLADKMSQSILKDLKDTMVCVTEPDGTEYFGGIVSEWRKTAAVPLPGGKLKGERHLLAVTISAAWMRLYNSTLTVQYRDMLPQIAKLKSGVLQALVRYCLTHRELNKKLDDLLIDIGAFDKESSKNNPRKYERARKAVVDADLSYFGISIRNDVVHYKQHNLIRFKNPSDTTCAVSDTTCAANDTTCAASQEIQELQAL